MKPEQKDRLGLVLRFMDHAKEQSEAIGRQLMHDPQGFKPITLVANSQDAPRGITISNELKVLVLKTIQEYHDKEVEADIKEIVTIVRDISHDSVDTGCSS